MSLASQISALAARVRDEFNTRPKIDDIYGPERTFTLPYLNGGLGGSVATALGAATAGSDRHVIKLQEDANKWRLRLRGYDAVNSTAKSTATLKKLIVGKHDRPISGTSQETGNFVGNTAYTIVSTDQTIPGDTNFLSCPWVSVANGYAADAVFQKETEFLLAWGYTLPASTALQTSAGRSWHWANSTSATDPTIAASGATQTYIPFDWAVDVEYTTRRKVCLVIGDSISEGITGSNSALASTPLWRNAYNIWASRENRLIVNMSVAGITMYAQAFNTSPVKEMWLRLNLGTYPIDEIIIASGSNDWAGAGRTLANLQDNFTTIVNYLRSLGITAPVYAATNLARGTTGDSVRLSYNEWLSSRPAMIEDVIDFDGATRGTTAQNLVDQYTPDSIHPSWLGEHALASELTRVMPRYPVLLAG